MLPTPSWEVDFERSHGGYCENVLDDRWTQGCTISGWINCGKVLSNTVLIVWAILSSPVYICQSLVTQVVNISFDFCMNSFYGPLAWFPVMVPLHSFKSFKTFHIAIWFIFRLAFEDTKLLKTIKSQNGPLRNFCCNSSPRRDVFFSIPCLRFLHQLLFNSSLLVLFFAKKLYEWHQTPVLLKVQSCKL